MTASDQPAYGFLHLSVHARPAAVLEPTAATIDARSVRALAVTPELLANPLPVTFEKACESLDRFPRMFVEPDGSFVWTGESPGGRWQLDGILYDAAGRLMYVELKGGAPLAVWQQLLDTFGAREQQLYQLIRAAVFVDHVELARMLAPSNPG